MGSITDNLKQVERNIAEACARAGRSRDEVTLIAVSKTKPVEDLKEAYDAGIREFGENKVQELVDKYEKLPKDIHWHMIGHLQRNKVKYIVDKVCLIHGVDSYELAEEINKQAEKKGVPKVDILIEINIGNEETKYGIRKEDTFELVDRIIRKLPYVNVRGLMCIAPYVEDPEENRQYFVEMGKIIVDIKSKLKYSSHVDVMSMGMTGDYQVAVEEGATMVRVGTGIFGERDYSMS